MDEGICEPYDWLEDAEIYNKKYEKVPIKWIKENADAVVLLFSAKGVDKDGIIAKFSVIYESVKFGNLPIEVIYVPMDDTEEEMRESYEEQANWFTFMISHPLVHVLRYMYTVSSIPHLVVMKPDGNIISRHGILDLESYRKNAIITWLSTAATIKSHRRMSQEKDMYGEKWDYYNPTLNVIVPEQEHSDYNYKRRFSKDPE